jgi:hypothetical protein
VQDKLHALETDLQEWAAVKEEFGMSATDIRGALRAWRTGKAATADEAAASMALPGLSEQDARDLKLFQAHRQAFFAWQMGSGLTGDSSGSGGGAATREEQSELQVSTSAAVRTRREFKIVTMTARSVRAARSCLLLRFARSCCNCRAASSVVHCACCCKV